MLGIRPGKNSVTVSVVSEISAAVSSLGTASGLGVGAPRPSRVALTVTPSTAGAPYMERSPEIRLKTGNLSGVNSAASLATNQVR